MSAINKIKETKRKVSRALFSRTAIAYLLILVSFAITVTYSLMDVRWDATKIDWGKFAWNMGLLLGIFVTGLFSGWMLEAQNLVADELSEFSKSKADYQEERNKILPKKQYFEQYRQWEVTNEINSLKAKELVEIGWRATDSDFSEDGILNATARDIAFYATEQDLRRAVKTDGAIEVKCNNGKTFYIAQISQELCDKTIKLLNEKCEIRFAEANYYLLDTNFEAEDTLPEFAQGLHLSKTNNRKARRGVESSLSFMLIVALLFAGATVDNFYGNTAEVWMNALSRVGGLLGGVLRGFGVADSFYDGLADMLKDKINVLEGFYNCVMKDGNFIPDTNTKTAKEVFLKAREAERIKAEKEAEERKKAVEGPLPEPKADDAPKEDNSIPLADLMNK
jgi:hypothetical protein